jgi:hypothetical protein
MLLRRGFNTGIRKRKGSGKQRLDIDAWLKLWIGEFIPVAAGWHSDSLIK